jgi:outer membrane protein
MMKPALYVVLSAICLYAGSASAQTPIPLSLKEAQDYAIKHSAVAKNAALDVLIQKAKNAEITGLAYPNISGKGEFSGYINPLKSFVPAEFMDPSLAGQGKFIPVAFIPRYSNTASLSASQVIFDGSMMVALQARNAIVRLSEQGQQLTEEELRYNIQRAYYSFVIAGRQYQILKNSLHNARSVAREIEVLRENGFVEKLEVDRTHVQVNNLATDSIRIGNVITLSEQLLKYQMGMRIDQPILLTDTAIEQNIRLAETLALEPSVDYNNRTDFRLLQTQLALNEYDLKRHRLSGMPSLAAFGAAAYNYASSNFKDLFQEKYIFYSMAGLQLNVPLFDGLQRHNRVKQARLAIEKNYNDISNLKLGIDFQVAQSRSSLRNSLMTLQNQERNLELAENVLDLSHKKYQAGVGSNLELTQAQNDLLQAQNNYFQSLLDVINAQSDLQKAYGLFK